MTVMDHPTHSAGLHDRAVGLTESTRFRTLSHWLSILLLLVAGMVTMTALFAAVVAPRLASQTPAWWRQPVPAAVRIEKADALDNGAATTFTKVRDLHALPKTDPAAAGKETPPAASEPWKVSLRGEDASAWLTERLPQWLANQHEPVTTLAGVKDIQVRFEGGRIYAGLQLSDDRRLWTTLTPTLNADGLTVHAGNLWMGRLPLPAAAVLAHKEGTPPPVLKNIAGGADLADALQGKRPLATDASIRLPDGRRVRLLALEVQNDRVVLTCRTEMER